MVSAVGQPGSKSGEGTARGKMKRFMTVTSPAETVCHVSETPRPGRAPRCSCASPDTSKARRPPARPQLPADTRPGSSGGAPACSEADSSSSEERLRCRQVGPPRGAAEVWAGGDMQAVRLTAAAPSPGCALFTELLRLHDPLKALAWRLRRSRAARLSMSFIKGVEGERKGQEEGQGARGGSL